MGILYLILNLAKYPSHGSSHILSPLVLVIKSCSVSLLVHGGLDAIRSQQLLLEYNHPMVVKLKGITFCVESGEKVLISGSSAITLLCVSSAFVLNWSNGLNVMI